MEEEEEKKVRLRFRNAWIPEKIRNLQANDGEELLNMLL